MSKSCRIFLTPQISEFWPINWHRCVTTCKVMEKFFFGGGSHLWAMAIQVIGHFEVTHKSLIYGMKVRQFWCNVIWKFVEDLFTYQKAPFENFCDLRFSRKSRWSEIVFAKVLHILCMGWEVKIDMSGQSNDCLRVCNVKMKKFLMGQKRGTCPRM